LRSQVLPALPTFVPVRKSIHFLPHGRSRQVINKTLSSHPAPLSALGLCSFLFPPFKRSHSNPPPPARAMTSLYGQLARRGRFTGDRRRFHSSSFVHRRKSIALLSMKFSVPRVSSPSRLPGSDPIPRRPPDCQCNRRRHEYRRKCRFSILFLTCVFDHADGSFVFHAGIPPDFFLPDFSGERLQSIISSPPRPPGRAEIYVKISVSNRVVRLRVPGRTQDTLRSSANWARRRLLLLSSRHDSFPCDSNPL